MANTYDFCKQVLFGWSLNRSMAHVNHSIGSSDWHQLAISSSDWPELVTKLRKSSSKNSGFRWQSGAVVKKLIPQQICSQSGLLDNILEYWKKSSSASYLCCAELNVCCVWLGKGVKCRRSHVQQKILRQPRKRSTSALSAKSS